VVKLQTNLARSHGHLYWWFFDQFSPFMVSKNLLCWWVLWDLNFVVLISSLSLSSISCHKRYKDGKPAKTWVPHSPMRKESLIGRPPCKIMTNNWNICALLLAVPCMGETYTTDLPSLHLVLHCEVCSPRVSLNNEFLIWELHETCLIVF